MTELFLDGTVSLHGGDNRDVLKSFADNSIDSVVTDPPYALVSITKRFGKDGSAPVVVPEGGSGAYARASRGFMGKQWDTGETAWREGFKCILIEREAEYLDDIRRRLKMANQGPVAREHSRMVALGKVDSHDSMPLFGGGQLNESDRQIPRTQEQVLCRPRRTIGPIGLKR